MFASVFPFADLIELMINVENLWVFWQCLLNRSIFGSAVAMTALPADTNREEMETAADSSRRLS